MSAVTCFTTIYITVYIFGRVICCKSERFALSFNSLNTGLQIFEFFLLISVLLINLKDNEINISSELVLFTQILIF